MWHCIVNVFRNEIIWHGFFWALIVLFQGSIPFVILWLLNSLSSHSTTELLEIFALLVVLVLI